eukprot:COSAG05_NODE_557_length_8701_cov_28.619972_4_plen_86_part_00
MCVCTHSTSHRHPSTYSPGVVVAGILRMSTTETPKGRSPEQRFVLPGILTESQGGVNSHSPAAPTEPFCLPSGRGFNAQVIPDGS